MTTDLCTVSAASEAGSDAGGVRWVDNVKAALSTRVLARVRAAGSRLRLPARVDPREMPSITTRFAGPAMVYNRRNLWFHLFTVHRRMVVEGPLPGLTVDEAFRRNTDGPECLISRAYDAARFLELCESAGFHGAFVGGDFARFELQDFERLCEVAVGDSRLGAEHKAFLTEPVVDERGYPVQHGRPAGVGGVDRFRCV